MTKPVSRKPSRKTWRRHLSWRRSLIAVVAAIGFVSGAVIVSYYNDFSSLIDARLSGERERTLPRVFARPMELRQGQALNQPEVIARLNALGYAQREVPTERGEFTVERDALLVMPRGGDHDAQLVRVSFASMEPDAEVAPRGIRRLAIADGDPVRSVGFDSPLLTALMTSGDREKRRRVPLDSMPLHMQQAVLAVEDQSFYSHPGINPVRLASAAYTNWFGDRSQLVGNSTVTQQLARMFFLADEFNAELTAGQRSYARKLREVIMSLVLERLASKEEILELYLNDVYLGQRGSFAIHGVAEAARLFFGKDRGEPDHQRGGAHRGRDSEPRAPVAVRQSGALRRTPQPCNSRDGIRDIHQRCRSGACPPGSLSKSWLARSTTKPRTSSTW